MRAYNYVSLDTDPTSVLISTDRHRMLCIVYICFMNVTFNTCSPTSLESQRPQQDNTVTVPLQGSTSPKSLVYGLDISYEYILGWQARVLSSSGALHVTRVHVTRHMTTVCRKYCGDSIRRLKWNGCMWFSTKQLQDEIKPHTIFYFEHNWRININLFKRSGRSRFLRFSFLYNTITNVH